MVFAVVFTSFGRSTSYYGTKRVSPRIPTNKSFREHHQLGSQISCLGHQPLHLIYMKNYKSPTARTPPTEPPQTDLLRKTDRQSVCVCVCMCVYDCTKYNQHTESGWSIIEDTGSLHHRSSNENGCWVSTTHIHFRAHYCLHHRSSSCLGLHHTPQAFY
jgi:hypothetical protein